MRFIGGYEIGVQARGRINHGLNTPFPCGVKVNAGVATRISKPLGSRPKRKKNIRVREIFRADALQRCAELGERRMCGLRVVRVRLDEQVHVLRKARLRVIDHREAAHNEVLNAMGLEGRQKVLVVLVHQARFSIL